MPRRSMVATSWTLFPSDHGVKKQCDATSLGGGFEVRTRGDLPRNEDAHGLTLP